MNSKIIVLDLYSVFDNLTELGRNMKGLPASGLRDYIRREQEIGSTVYFICGAAHYGYMRQCIENFLEKQGFKSFMVTHGLPDGFYLFISRRVFKFDGQHFPE